MTTFSSFTKLSGCTVKHIPLWMSLVHPSIWVFFNNFLYIFLLVIFLRFEEIRNFYNPSISSWWPKSSFPNVLFLFFGDIFICKWIAIAILSFHKSHVLVTPSPKAPACMYFLSSSGFAGWSASTAWNGRCMKPEGDSGKKPKVQMSLNSNCPSYCITHGSIAPLP